MQNHTRIFPGDRRAGLDLRPRYLRVHAGSLAALGRSASLEVANRSAFVGDNQCALELAGVSGVDAEVRRKLHRALHTLWYVGKRTIAEHCCVERSVEVVAVWNDGSEVLLDEIGMGLHRFAE